MSIFSNESVHETILEAIKRRDPEIKELYFAWAVFNIDKEPESWDGLDCYEKMALIVLFEKNKEWHDYHITPKTSFLDALKSIDN